jgi:hypothetical protein
VKAVERNVAIDAVKGLLVLVMVVYHWLNYFVTSDGAVYKYLRFVTPSFIFVTGFLITGAYLGKYRIGEWALHERLFIRGVKLVALFTVLNVVAAMTILNVHGLPRLGAVEFLEKAPAIYLAGSGTHVVFEVLVPIGYLLSASSILLWGCKLHRHFVLVMWLVCVGLVYGLRWRGVASVNAELLTMGLLGMVIGRCGLKGVDRATRRTGLWLGGYVIYLIALRTFDVVYELQVVGLILNVVLLYRVGRSLVERSAIAREVILLGQYSLLAYIAQIAALQVLLRATRALEFGKSAQVIALAGTILLMCLAVEVTGWGRRRSPLLDRAYRMVFA